MSSPIDTGAIRDALVSHAQTLGLYDAVNLLEPRRAPGRGLTASIWMQRIRPFPQRSGLAVTSAIMVWTVRSQISLGAFTEEVDPDLTDAVATLIGAYSADFTLDGLISHVDLLGASGERLGLSGEAGYLEQDGALFRIMDLNVPLVLHDVWGQSA